ncbi:ELMO domain-containing protein B [Galdieria sulphuraria]|uniref:Engulfment and cell motility ELM family protein n=1 Tax=Galdieria sulphuraria TaxID=130081 RepID=M2XF90_GALSU|nr:engulfment and cell motility ELM family protein [Galdieria sulphuraria]EME28667.1 engulfment and cell motility ELM family protein [Galdieria sulphuraria]GJD10700.1 ELMO domain-containing protein B [Galdieria sulphuraria]|eukprot:XP_005705187.1 engulfment and cell motility ELM family protein [Galdieria sulphuraria]
MVYVQRWTTTLWRFLTHIVKVILQRDKHSYFISSQKRGNDIAQFCHLTLPSGSGPQTIKELKSSLQNTPSCINIYHVIQNNADFDVELISNWILEKTPDNSESIKTELVSVLEDLKHIQYLKERIRQRQTTCFDHSNSSHEEALIKLWNLLLASTSHESFSKKSEEWTKLGFQGKDPATDFRGGGLLSLQQLVYFAETRRELFLQMLNEASQSYPFACVGIRCTVAIVQLLDEDYLDTLLYGCSEEQAFIMIHERYCELWIRFHRSWKHKKWSDIMSFKTGFEEQLNKAKQSLRMNGYISETDE